MTSVLLERARGVVEAAAEVYRGSPEGEQLLGVLGRLDEPLRVAIAGRVKSGKSTLLNALVGERLAPTDAGECTRIVTWYVDGHTYQVTLRLRAGTHRQTRFHREDHSLVIDISGVAEEAVESIEVMWPSRALRTATLIDTPGVGSMTAHTSARSWELLVPQDEATTADAVIYLMKHLHATDLEFLRAFHDHEVSQPNPVNSIGVLSRADEIGVGRLDAMRSARTIARRLAADGKVRRVMQTVVPVAGLLAETAATLTEVEAKHLRVIAEIPVEDSEALLLTADRFLTRQPGLGLTEIERQLLLDRFGLFGIRLGVSLLRRRPQLTASDVARELTEHSGLDALRGILHTLFFERRDVLKARSALLGVEAVVRRRPVAGSDTLAAAVEEVIASAHPFHEMRVLSSIRAGTVAGRPDVLDDLERIIGGEGGAPRQRLGLLDTAPVDDVRDAAEASLLRWQRRGANPLTSHALSVAATVAVRSCEGILDDLRQAS